MSEDYKRVELFRQTDAKRFDNTEKHDMSFMRQAAETGAETKIEANAGIKADACLLYTSSGLRRHSYSDRGNAQ